MRTMTRRYSPTPGPPGERRAMCAYCGIFWYRSQMRRDASGQLACPDDQQGRDQVTLNRLNSQGARTVKYPRPTVDKW